MKKNFKLNVLFLAAWASVSCQTQNPQEYHLHTVKKINLENTLTETGELGSEIEINLDAPFSSKLNAILDEGVQVKKGQKIGHLETVKELEQRDGAKLAVQEAQFDIELEKVTQTQKTYELGKRLENAKLDLKIEKLKGQKLRTERDQLALTQVSEELKTLAQEIGIYQLEARERERLYKQGYLSKEESEKARLKLAEAKKNQTHLKTKLQVLKQGPLKETLKKQEININKRLAHLKEVQKENLIQKRISLMSIKSTQIRFKKDTEKFEYYGELVQKGELKASAQGTLVYGKMRIGKELVRIKAGDSIQEGVTLARIIDLNKPLVRLFVHEIDAGLIQKGLKARVNLDAYPEQIYSAEVSKIVPVAKKKFENDRNNLRGFDVEVRILKGDKHLKPGMTANVEIIQKVYAQVVAIPSQAIFRDEKHDFCWVKSGSDLEQRAVQVGISTELMSVIKSGLNPGDKVVLNPKEVSL